MKTINIKKEVLTIPNIITTIRLISALILSYIVLKATNLNPLITVPIFVIIASSDFLDGLIARKYNITSQLGKILDPICDKSINIVLAGCLIYKEIMPLWSLLPLVIRDAISFSCYSYTWTKNKEKRKELKPSHFAKMKMIFQSSSIGAALITNSFNPLAFSLTLVAFIVGGIDLDETIRTSLLNKEKRKFSLKLDNLKVSNIFKLGARKKA